MQTQVSHSRQHRHATRVHPAASASHVDKKRRCRRRQRPHPTRPVRVAWPHCQALPDHVGPARLSTWTACGGGAPTVTRNGGGEPVVTCRAPDSLTASRLSTGHGHTASEATVTLTTGGGRHLPPQRSHPGPPRTRSTAVRSGSDGAGSVSGFATCQNGRFAPPGPGLSSPFPPSPFHQREREVRERASGRGREPATTE